MIDLQTYESVEAFPVSIYTRVYVHDIIYSRFEHVFLIFYIFGDDTLKKKPFLLTSIFF